MLAVTVKVTNTPPEVPALTSAVSAASEPSGAVAVLGVMVVDDFDQVPAVMSLLCGTWLMVPASTISTPS